MTDLFESCKADITHVQQMLLEQRQMHEQDGSTANMKKAIDNQFTNVMIRLKALRKLQPNQSLELQNLCFQGPWSGSQKGEMADVLTSLHSSANLPSSSSSQTLSTFAPFLTQENVQTLSDPNISTIPKIVVLAERAVQIGLRRPDEPSFRHMFAAGISCGIVVAASQRMLYFEELKKKFRNLARSAGAPKHWLQTYPTTLEELPQELQGGASGGADEGSALDLAGRLLPCRRSSKIHKHAVAGEKPAFALCAQARALSANAFLEPHPRHAHHAKHGKHVKHPGQHGQFHANEPAEPIHGQHHDDELVHAAAATADDDDERSQDHIYGRAVHTNLAALLRHRKTLSEDEAKEKARADAQSALKDAGFPVKEGKHA
eukprot:Skav230333  [mRNA]  locus=scaffold1130:21632:23132:+ [translate_table: standard]